MTMKTKRSLARISALILLFNSVLIAATASGGATFDLAADFSTNSNPNGPWTYFGVDSAGSLHTLTNSIAGGWNLSTNPLTYIVSSTNMAGTLVCHAGYVGSPIPRSVPIALDERLVLPQGADGTYLITISAYALPPEGLVANPLSVSKNGQVILSIPPDITGRNYPTNVTLALATGDTVDFLQMFQGQPQIQFEAVLSQPAASPSIITQLLSQTVVLGSTASFSVTATGAPPLSYQWLFGTNTIAGATNLALNLTNIQYAQAGDYAVLVSGPGGSVTSSNAVLVVTAPPVNGTNVFDLAADFSITQNPNGPWTYGGYDTFGVFRSFTNYGVMNVPGWSDGGPIYLSKGNLPGTLLCGVGNFGTDPFHRDNPFNLAERFTVPPGADGTYGLTVTASANNGSDNGWAVYKSPLGTNQYLLILKNETPCLSCNSNNYTYVSLNAGDILYFNQSGGFPMNFNSVVSQSKLAAAITAQPASQTTLLGTPVAFSVTASGFPPLAYQWLFGTNAIAGATNSVLSLTNIQYAQAGTYSVVVSGPVGGSVTSSNALLTVLTPVLPSITAQPTNQAVKVGAGATLSVGATGSAPISYQWYVGASGDISSPISGATNAVFAAAQLFSSASFWVSVANPFGTAKSASALVTVVPENSVKLGFGLTGGFPSLTIFGNVGASYHLEYKTNLQATNWSPLLNIVLSLSSYSFTDSGFTNSTRFYRVRSP